MLTVWASWLGGFSGGGNLREALHGASIAGAFPTGARLCCVITTPHVACRRISSYCAEVSL